MDEPVCSKCKKPVNCFLIRSEDGKRYFIVACSCGLQEKRPARGACPFCGSTHDRK